MTRDFPKIVLTGGPGGGKTTLMRELRKADPNAEKWILVPEAATILIRAGHRPGSKEFQLAVVEIQASLEKACAVPAKVGQVMVCDRSTVDSLAYWLKLGGPEEEFYVRTAISKEEHYGRYLGAIQLQTTAIGAEPYYQRFMDGARVEPPEEAAEIERLCAQVWSRHPAYRLVENCSGGWAAKSKIAMDCLMRLVEEAHR